MVYKEVEDMQASLADVLSPELSEFFAIFEALTWYNNVYVVIVFQRFEFLCRYILAGMNLDATKVCNFLICILIWEGAWQGQTNKSIMFGIKTL